jgi:hypothetical protein
MALAVTLQFKIMFECTIPIESWSVGCPSIPCASCAALASSTSHLVNIAILLRTVLMVSWTKHSNTSASTSFRLRYHMPRSLFCTMISPSFV